jgi:hypothetical protein
MMGSQFVMVSSGEREYRMVRAYPLIRARESPSRGGVNRSRPMQTKNSNWPQVPAAA